MKTNTSPERPETRTVTLLAGLSIGLGLVVHELFFVVAGAILLIRPLERLAHYIHDREHSQYRPV